MEGRDADGALDRLGDALRSALDASVQLVPRSGATRHCTTARCLCGHEVWREGHVTALGHGSLDQAFDVLLEKVCSHISTTPCSCCKKERRLAKRAMRYTNAEWPDDSSCPSPSFDDTVPSVCGKQLPQRSRPKEVRHCHYCGSTEHLIRHCTFGSTTHRSQQFLRCSNECFVRRFVVPLHHARSDFSLDDLTDGRVDLASRLISSAIVCSQRLRHNTELWLPFLGDTSPTSVCVTGGLVRGLHPSELSTAKRLREAFDAFDQGDLDADSPPPPPHSNLKGFRLLPGGLGEALTEALTLARADGTRAPLLLLVQGAPMIAEVLNQNFSPFAATAKGGSAGVDLDIEAHGLGALQDLVIVLGDHIGLSEDEIELVAELGASVAGGGPVLRASLAQGALLASHCIVIANHYLDAIHDCPSQLWQVSAEHRKSNRQRSRRVSRKSQKRANQGYRGATLHPTQSESSSDDEDAVDEERSSESADGDADDLEDDKATCIPCAPLVH